MNPQNEIENYLFYCRYQKQLDEKTVRAYKADLKQIFYNATYLFHFLSAQNNF